MAIGKAFNQAADSVAQLKREVGRRGMNELANVVDAYVECLRLRASEIRSSCSCVFRYRRYLQQAIDRRLRSVADSGRVADHPSVIVNPSDRVR